MEEFLKKDMDLLALIGSLKSESFIESKFKIFILGEIFSKYSVDENISKEDILILTEDTIIPYPDDDIFRIIESMGILEPLSESEYRITGKMNLSNLFFDASQYDLKVATNEYLQLMEKFRSIRKSYDLFDYIKTIKRTQGLSLQIINNSNKNGLHGIPVFIDCMSNNEHIFMSENIGLETTIDTYKILYIPIKYKFQHQYELLKYINKMVSSINSFQETKDGWNIGGYYPGDEIPGSDFPLVDSTSGAVSFFLFILMNFSKDVSNSSNDLFKNINRSILLGIDFLLKMQIEDGSWSYYRYENDRYKLETNYHSCRLAIETLSLFIKINTINKQINMKVTERMERFKNFVSNNMRVNGNKYYWEEKKVVKEDTQESIILPTIDIIETYLALVRNNEDERNKIGYIIKGGIESLIDFFMKNNGENKQMETIVPTRNGPTSINCAFNIPINIRISSLLIDYSNQMKINIDNNVWIKIKNIIVKIIEDQIHGHWSYPLDGKPSIPFTYYYYELLLKYIYYQIENIKIDENKGCD